MFSVRVASLGWLIMARIFAPLLSARGVAALATFPLPPFLLVLAGLREAGLALPPLAFFWPMGASFFRVARFFEEACSGATVAPCSATFAAVLASALVILFSVSFSVLG